MPNGEHSLEKALGEVTLRKSMYERELVSSGIRELDDMMGGGFRPGNSTLLQEDLGAGGLIILEKIINIQLSLDNKVLIVYTDPTADFYIKRIKEMPLADDNLIILDFVKKSKKDVEILFDKHEISLEINEAQDLLMEMLKKEDEDDIAAFVVYFSLNTLVMNLDEKTVTRFLFENMLKNMRNQTITLALLQRDIIAKDYHARISALFHAVIDLQSEYKGIQKKNYIRIKKYVGRYFDSKVEPYSITFDVNRNKFNFLIKSAFLTSFDTYRDLLEWQAGTIYLSKIPYILTPVAYINMLLEIPLNLDKEKGKEELIEKGMAIGRILTVNTESLYHLTSIDLLKATLRAAALQGYGYMRVVEYQRDENLLMMRQTIHPDFNLKPYTIFLEGFFRGMIKRSLERTIRTIKFKQADMSDEIVERKNEPIFMIKIRLGKMSGFH